MAADPQPAAEERLEELFFEDAHVGVFPQSLARVRERDPRELLGLGPTRVDRQRPGPVVEHDAGAQVGLSLDLTVHPTDPTRDRAAARRAPVDEAARRQEPHHDPLHRDRLPAAVVLHPSDRSRGGTEQLRGLGEVARVDAGHRGPLVEYELRSPAEGAQVTSGDLDRLARPELEIAPGGERDRA